MGYTIDQYHGNYNRTARSTAVKYIVVHNTGAGTSRTGSALANCKYFSGGNRNASAHYFVDDGSIYEYADPAAYATWHCGDGGGRYGISNANSIGIEVCSNGVAFTTEEIARLTWLVQQLMGRFGVPADRVVRHYDASRKACPMYYVNNPTAWTNLRKQITNGSATTVAPAATAPATAKASGGDLLVDGSFGPLTIKKLQSALLSHNCDPQGIDGVWGYWSKLACQKYLKACGEYTGLLDGDFGKMSIRALQTHCRNRGFKDSIVDGIWGRLTTVSIQKCLNAGKF